MRRVFTVLGVLAGVMLMVVAPALAGDAEVAMVDTSSGEWHVREPNGSERTFFYGNPGDTPLLGDWNCDGVETPGMFRQSTGFVYLTSTNPLQGEAPFADRVFFFGVPGDIPIAGDWNGDGCDTLGIYRGDKVFLRNSLSTGVATIEFFFGVPGDRPFAGDWDGDGIDTVGIYRNSSGQVFYTNENPVGPVATTANDFYYGIPSDRFIPGDWDADDVDTVGIFRPSESRFYLRNTNSTGPADETLVFGQSSWSPLGGDLELREAALSTPSDPFQLGPVGLGGSITNGLRLNFSGDGGDADLQITNVIVLGLHAAEFSVAPLADPEIGFGETRDIQVTLAPSTVGVKRAEVHIDHTGANSPLVVSVIGQGAYRVNAGGDPIADWGPDSPYSPGGSIGPVAGTAVSGPTAPDGVFESYRFGQQAWDFAVVPGAYRVNLYFAETFPGTQSTGARQFNVAIEGDQVLTAFDIFSAAGANNGIVRGFDIVSDANLDIDLTQVVNSPAIQGIEVIPTPTWKSLGSSPSQATYGSIAVGDTLRRTITVVNLGEPATAGVNLAMATVVGADSNQFGFVSGVSARTLQPGQVSEIVLEYKPTRTGVVDARLHIDHDGPNSPLEVNLVAAADDVILYRLNTGGEAVVGQFSWTPDEPFVVPGTPSGEFALVEAINTADQSIPPGTPLSVIRTERFGSTSVPLAYDLPVPDGPYEVRLYFVEAVHNAAGIRVFDVKVEGGLAINDLDIYARAGRNKAIMIPLQTNVTGGLLDIDLVPISGKNLPAIHGIEVVKKEGNAILTSEPVTLTLGPIVTTATTTGAVEIANGGGAGIPSVVVEAVGIGGPFAGRFTLLSGPQAGDVLPPGTGDTAVIQYVAGWAGDKPGSLVIVYNGGRTLTVPLLGAVNNPPVITTPANQTVNEGQAFSLTVSATDPDLEFRTMSVSGLPAWASVTGSGNGVITFGGTPGFGDAGTSVVTVTVSDADGATDSGSFNLTVVNVNRAPSFNSGLLDQADSEGDSVSVSTEATDLDGDDLTWSATNLPQGLTINPSSGLISGTIGLLAFDNQPLSGFYTVTVTVTDNGSPNLSDTDVFLWTISGANRLPTAVSVSPGVTEGGSVTSTLTGSDLDGDPLTFSLFGPAPVNGSITSGPTSTGPTSASITYLHDGLETTTDSFQFRVNDGTDFSAPATVSIVVTPVNDRPVATTGITGVVAEGDSVVVSLTATDPDGPPLTFAAFSPANGSVGPVTSTGPGSANVTFTHNGSQTSTASFNFNASDGSLTSVNATVTLTVNLNVDPTVTAPGDQVYTVGVAITDLVVTGSDTDGTIVSTVVTGLPAGLSTTGGTTSVTITGTPTAATGAVTVTITVTDDDGGTGSDTFSITVNAAPNVDPTVTAPGDQVYTVGVAITDLVVTGSDTDGTIVSTVVTGLPAGLSTTGGTTSVTITGTPTAATGAVTVTITVTDDDGGTGSDTFSITVNAAPNVDPTVTAPGDQVYTVGVAITDLVVTGSDTDGTIVSTVVTGLPAGLSTTGGTTSVTITGTPTAATGAVTVTITVTDDDGGTGSDTFSITVNAAPNVDPTVTAPGDQVYTVGVAITDLVVTGSDTDGTIVSTVVTGLPAGLSTTGGTTSVTITGTPTAATGAVTVTITVTDDDGGTGSDTFSITVNAAPNVDPTVTAPGDQVYTVGVAITDLVVTGSDTDGTIVSTVVTGLPAGLSTTGGTTSVTITGTPTAATGAVTVTITVTDDDGGTGSDTFSITVNAAPNVDPTVTAPGDQVYTVGVAITDLVVTGSDTDGTIVSTVVTGLPAGLSTTGGTTSVTITGTPTAATGAVTVTITVTDDDGGTGSDTFSITVNA